MSTLLPPPCQRALGHEGTGRGRCRGRHCWLIADKASEVLQAYGGAAQSRRQSFYSSGAEIVGLQLDANYGVLAVGAAPAGDGGAALISQALHGRPLITNFELKGGHWTLMVGEVYSYPGNCWQAQASPPWAGEVHLSNRHVESEPLVGGRSLTAHSGPPDHTAQ